MTARFFAILVPIGGAALVMSGMDAPQVQPEAPVVYSHYSERWGEPDSPDPRPPVGTILPFYGDPRLLEGTGWVPCDGQKIPQWADEQLKRLLAAHPPQDPREGNRLPNLNGGRFLRGASDLSDVGFVGGREQLDPDGEHTHASDGQRLRRGAEDSTPLNHDLPAGRHDHGAENRPPFVNVTFIMRVK